MSDFLISWLPDDWTAPAELVPNGLWWPVLGLLLVLSATPLVLAWRLWRRLRRRIVLYTGLVLTCGGASIAASMRTVVAGAWVWIMDGIESIPAMNDWGHDILTSVAGWASGGAAALFVLFFLWALMDNPGR